MSVAPLSEEAVTSNDDAFLPGALGPGGRGPTNTLPLWGNKQSMNLNSLILDNILASPYFKTSLFQLKTYHEVIDEIYYNVQHLEPWERGSRKMAGVSGARAMEVRGVCTGGIVSTPYCCLYKLFTLKLTRKQLTGLLNHTDSPYIRGLGFMYIRYCQPPDHMWDWFEPYLDDEESVDPKAGGGDEMMMGQMLKLIMTKLDWYGTLFPRIPVPVAKKIDENLRERNKRKLDEAKALNDQHPAGENGVLPASQSQREDRESAPPARQRSRDRERRDRSTDRRHEKSRSRSPYNRQRPRSTSHDRNNQRSKHKRSRSRSKDRHHDHSARNKSSHRKHKHKKHKHHHKRSRSRSKSAGRRSISKTKDRK